MNLNELIERLEDYRDQLSGDAQVRLMTQQHWPFENDIYGLASGEEINHPEDEEDAAEGEDVEQDQVVYIVEGLQIGYGSKRAWDVAGNY